MPISKRNKTWWIDVTTSSGVRVRQSAGTQVKTEAQQLHDRIKSEAWRVEKLNEKPSRTWDEAAVLWLRETSHKKDHEGDKSKLRWLTRHLRGVDLNRIDREMVAQITSLKQAEASAATTNRHLALVRSILRRAEREWEWIAKAPYVRLLKEPKGRERWLTVEQVKSLLNELPEHQVSIVMFALASGLRQSNILQLEWNRVDLKRRTCWVVAGETKNDDSLHVSLNETAHAILVQQEGKHSTRVFTYRGNPIAWANTRAWRAALKRAGIANFRWHDLRHTWASWMIQGGVPEFVLQRMGGWKTASMLKRYAHLSPAIYAKHAHTIDKAMRAELV